jgi:L-alanine-DL-glutamate epimerase-like enolase superfamily enzyme
LTKTGGLTKALKLRNAVAAAEHARNYAYAIHTYTITHTNTYTDDVVNIKLDKTGGLTEALKLKDAAAAAGMRIMVGCMVATSLAMAVR